MDNIIIRGTTPTLSADIPFDADILAKAEVIITQMGRAVIEKHLEDCRVEGKRLSVTLTQEETLALNHKFPAELQVNVKSVSGTVLKTLIDDIAVGRILKEGVI